MPQEGLIAARAARVLEHWIDVSVVEEDVDREPVGPSGIQHLLEQEAKGHR